MREKHKLTKREKDCVREWLKLTEGAKGTTCPFWLRAMDWFLAKECKQICFVWFPRSKKCLFHPCEVYKQYTVIRRAKEMVK